MFGELVGGCVGRWKRIERVSLERVFCVVLRCSYFILKVMGICVGISESFKEVVFYFIWYFRKLGFTWEGLVDGR